jgi:hypothetical protein
MKHTNIFLILILLISFILIWLFYSDKGVINDIELEGFQINSSPSISFCPQKWNVYYDANGDTMCCDGEVHGNTCAGTPKCVLSGSSGKKGLPLCSSIHKKNMEENSTKICPTSMQNYFENKQKPHIIGGCTSANVNADSSAPVPGTSDDKICHVYDSNELNMFHENSCENYKMMESVECFGKDCVKKIQSSQNLNEPALITVSFSDDNGNRHTGYTRESYRRYLDFKNPQWKAQSAFDINKNIKISEVQKAVYIDKTLSASQVVV